MAANIPTRFRDSPRGSSLSPGGVDTPLNGTGGGRPPRGVEGLPGEPRTSTHSVTRLSGLTGYWHQDPAGTSSHPLELSGAGGLTYGTVFRDLQQGPSFLPPTPRWIYWAHTFRVERFGPHVKFTVSRSAAPSQPARIWVPGEIAGLLLPPDLLERVTEATRGAPSTLYVLGSFHWNERFGYPELVPLSVHHVWIEPGLPAFPI